MTRYSVGNCNSGDVMLTMQLTYKSTLSTVFKWNYSVWANILGQSVRRKQTFLVYSYRRVFCLPIDGKRILSAADERCSIETNAAHWPTAKFHESSINPSATCVACCWLLQHNMPSGMHLWNCMAHQSGSLFEVLHHMRYSKQYWKRITIGKPERARFWTYSPATFTPHVAPVKFEWKSYGRLYLSALFLLCYRN